MALLPRRWEHVSVNARIYTCYIHPTSYLSLQTYDRGTQSHTILHSSTKLYLDLTSSNPGPAFSPPTNAHHSWTLLLRGPDCQIKKTLEIAHIYDKPQAARSIDDPVAFDFCSTSMYHTSIVCPCIFEPQLEQGTEDTLACLTLTFLTSAALIPCAPLESTALILTNWIRLLVPYDHVQQSQAAVPE
jgi:hypothetical protein